MKHDPVLAGQRLRAVLSMPEYKDTLGAWLEELKQSALHALSTETEQTKLFHAQGAFAAAQSVFDQIDRVLRAEEVALERAKKKRNEEATA